MADLYDDQFRQRVMMHTMVCDPLSADIISAMGRFLDRERRESLRLRNIIEQVKSAVSGSVVKCDKCSNPIQLPAELCDDCKGGGY